MWSYFKAVVFFASFLSVVGPNPKLTGNGISPEEENSSECRIDLLGNYGPSNFFFAENMGVTGLTEENNQTLDLLGTSEYYENNGPVFNISAVIDNLGDSNIIDDTKIDNEDPVAFLQENITEDRNSMDIVFQPKFSSTPKKTRDPLSESHESSNEAQHLTSFAISDSSFCELSNITDMDEVKSKENNIYQSGNGIKKFENKLLRKAMSTALIGKLSAQKCKRKCLKGCNVDFIKKLRYCLWTKNFEGRVEWFCDKYSEAVNKKSDISFLIDGGKPVCSKCFRHLYNINKNFYSKYIKKFTNGALAAGNRRGRSATPVSANTVKWFEEYTTFHGDRMPDKRIVLLPYKTRKIDIFELYESEQIEDMKRSSSKSAFYEIWNRHFPHVKIKQTNSFSKCNTCTNLEKQLELTRDPSRRKYIKHLILVHQTRQMKERQYYYQKRNKAKLQQKEYMSLIIDGMDQSKTNLPHFTGRKSNSLDIAHLLQTHVQGVINHGLGRFAKYLDINEYCHDSNMVMNTLLKEIYQASLLMDNKLPRILFLQADNCYRENKNKFMLGFCEMLVRQDIFKEVFMWELHTDANGNRVLLLPAVFTLLRNHGTGKPEYEGFIVNCLNTHVLTLAFYEYLDYHGHIGDEEPIHD